jgi:hypothetical protein
MVARRVVQVPEASTTLIWYKQVPTKVYVLAWRLLRNRLPTKDNLLRRHVIPHEFSFCVTGCGGVETAQHLFLSCPVFAPLWSLVISWVGMFSVDPLLLQDHLAQFSHSAGGSRARCPFLQLLWLCTVWVVWNERNNRLFKAKESAVHEMLENVKMHSLGWMKAHNVNLGVNSHMWWSNTFWFVWALANWYMTFCLL